MDDIELNYNGSGLPTNTWESFHRPQFIKISTFINNNTTLSGVKENVKINQLFKDLFWKLLEIKAWNIQYNTVILNSDTVKYLIFPNQAILIFQVHRNSL